MKEYPASARQCRETLLAKLFSDGLIDVMPKALGKYIHRFPGFLPRTLQLADGGVADYRPDPTERNR
jgi:hypothetical protein